MMKPRTIIGIVFILASLTKLATILGLIKWSWFAKVSEEPMYLCKDICHYSQLFVLLQRQ